MLFKNIAGQKCIVYAHDAVADAPKTSDANNITANVSKDGAASSPSNDVNPTEIGGGLYAFDLTQAEANCDLFALYAASTTANVKIDPVVAYTQGGAVPKATPGGAGGLPTVDASNLIAGVQAAGRNAIADALLLRDVSNVEASAGDHSLCYVVLAMSESNTVDQPGMLTVYKTDGVSEFVRKSLRTSPDADAVTGVC